MKVSSKPTPLLRRTYDSRYPGEVHNHGRIPVRFAAKFLFAINEAAAIYRHIASVKGEGNFVTEVSMDEVDQPQQPLDLLFILKGLADLKVPVQTIAPKFTGRFNKGVDYEGDPVRFGKEFEEDILVIKYAVRHFGLPAALNSVYTQEVTSSQSIL